MELIFFFAAFLVHLASETLIHADDPIWQKVSLFIQSFNIILVSFCMLRLAEDKRGEARRIQSMLSWVSELFP